MRRACRRPFCGGTNASTRSVNTSSPTRSLLRTADMARVAATSGTISLFIRPRVPQRCDAERSTARSTVSSRSSTYFLTNAWPVRAETFQSMVRTSSPGTYGRTCASSVPSPRCGER
jgi:hypothetical protein